jgi:hypothetical protein
VEVLGRVLGEEHPDTLTSMNNLAGSFQGLGDLPGARDLFERAFEGFRRVLGDEHPSTLLAKANLEAVVAARDAS